MTAVKTRAWPLFALAALFAVLGIVVLDGVAAGVVSLACAIAFITACLRGLHLTADKDAVERLGRSGLIGGGF